MKISTRTRFSSRGRSTLAVALCAVFLGTPATAGEDLGKVYKGKLDYDENAGGVDWTAEPEDVWALKSFQYKLSGKFELEFGPSTVVFGKHGAGKKGNSVVWAALFPDEPGEISSSEAGHGNHVQAIFLRLHPSLVAELFPRKTVIGPGDPMYLIRAKRQYRHKINSGWQWDNMPVVPWEHSLTFDMDTVEGKRRRYSLDLKKKSVECSDHFTNRVLSPQPEDAIDTEEAVAIFRQAWEAFDEEYAMFVVKPAVDWDALRERYEPLAARAKTAYEVAAVIGLLVDHLEDLHVYVKVGEAYVDTYNRFRVQNANWKAVKGTLQGLKEGNGIAWAETNYGLGYINIWNLSEDGMSGAFDEALEGLGETVGLIVDIRFNGGGDEVLARRLAARFLDQERIYSTNQYRNGKGHEELGNVLDRSFEPRGPWRYQAPVVVLQGQKTMSSAESLALMFAQCPDVTTMGDRTAGSSANPRRLELPHDIVVNLPRWLDMDPDRKPIDGVGILPQKAIEATSVADFKESDPVFEAAVQLLKKTKNRKPGKR